MNRDQLQGLAEIRLVEAKTLLDAGHYSGSYYLAGYAIECGLKACIAKMTMLYDFPDRKRVEESYRHSPETLLRTAGLQVELQQMVRSDPAFANNWTIVREWTETSRYETHIQPLAQDMYQAVSDNDHGVLSWITLHW